MSQVKRNGGGLSYGAQHVKGLFRVTGGLKNSRSHSVVSEPELTRTLFWTWTGGVTREGCVSNPSAKMVVSEPDAPLGCATQLVEIWCDNDLLILPWHKLLYARFPKGLACISWRNGGASGKASLIAKKKNSSGGHVPQLHV